MRLKIFLSALNIALLTSGCRTLPQLDYDKTYRDQGRIINRIGDYRCYFEIATDHHGVIKTDIIEYDECHAYGPGHKVEVEIYETDRVRILRRAAP